MTDNVTIVDQYTSYFHNFTTATNNVTTLDAITAKFHRAIPATKIFLGVFMFSVIIVSFTANLFVIVSFMVEKKLRNSFTTLVVNLAVTDLLINVIAMDFYTINIIFEYWPFGKVLCGVWVFFDYTTVFSSSWSLAAISIDRFWSIRWSVNYRNLKGYRKPLIMIIIVWFSVAAIVWYPVISDRIKRTRQYICVYEPSENPEFVIVLALFGHHTPCFIIILMTILVYMEIRKLAKIRPGGVGNAPPSIEISHSKPSHSEDDSSGTVTKRLENPKDGKSEEINEAGCWKILRKVKLLRKIKSRESPKVDKEGKAFLTLAHIVFCYVITWVPFHIIYDIKMVNPDSYSVNQAFEYLFWLTYVNSAINPFLYAHTSPELKNAFRRLCRCFYTRRTRE